jgi:hypothetical protein
MMQIPMSCPIRKIVVLKTTKLLCALWLAGLGVASTHFPDYPVQPVREYKFKVEQHGVIIAAEPVDETQAQKEYFRADLRARGYLPVLLVIENASGSEEYMFDSSAVGLAEGFEVEGKGARKTANAKTSGGIIDLTLLKADGSIHDVAVRENLIKKHIRSSTLGPGAVVHGFVYIPVATEGARAEIHLQVPLTNAKSGEIEVFNISF